MEKNKMGVVAGDGNPASKTILPPGPTKKYRVLARYVEAWDAGPAPSYIPGVTLCEVREYLREDDKGDYWPEVKIERVKTLYAHEANIMPLLNIYLEARDELKRIILTSMVEKDGKDEK